MREYVLGVVAIAMVICVIQSVLYAQHASHTADTALKAAGKSVKAANTALQAVELLRSEWESSTANMNTRLTALEKKLKAADPAVKAVDLIPKERESVPDEFQANVKARLTALEKAAGNSVKAANTLNRRLTVLEGKQNQTDAMKQNATHRKKFKTRKEFLNTFQQQKVIAESKREEQHQKHVVELTAAERQNESNTRWSKYDLEQQQVSLPNIDSQQQLGAGRQPQDGGASCAYVNPAWGLPQKQGSDGRMRPVEMADVLNASLFDLGPCNGAVRNTSADGTWTKLPKSQKYSCYSNRIGDEILPHNGSADFLKPCCVHIYATIFHEAMIALLPLSKHFAIGQTKYKVDVFAQSSTLLGTLRHSGMIPNDHDQ